MVPLHGVYTHGLGIIFRLVIRHFIFCLPILASNCSFLLFFDSWHNKMLLHLNQEYIFLSSYYTLLLECIYCNNLTIWAKSSYVQWSTRIFCETTLLAEYIRVDNLLSLVPRPSHVFQCFTRNEKHGKAWVQGYNLLSNADSYLVS